MVRRFGDPVAVRFRAVDAAEDVPEQFLWHNRLYVVRAVLAHWVEAGAWWRRRGSDGLPTTVDAVEREVWRVEADAGRAGVRGVYDLARDDASGRWSLARTID